MSRRDDERLEDVLASAAAIAAHLHRGDLHDGLVFDAVRVRLIEIGEAIKDISPDVLTSEPDIPWRAVVRMRDRLAHRYFDTALRGRGVHGRRGPTAARRRRRAAAGADAGGD